MLRKTSSDIPRAREILELGLKKKLAYRTAIRNALHLMIRKSADFRAPKETKPLTKKQRQEARVLRRKGLSLFKIGNRYGVQAARISEAVNGKLHKRRGNSRRRTY
jgi:hypothetical protein